MDPEETKEEVQGEQKEAEQKQEATIPKDRFDEVNTKLKNAEEANAMLGQQMALMKANQPRSAPQAEFDIYKKVGLDLEDENEMPTAKQLKAINDHNQKQLDAKLEHIRFLQDHPDFAQLVGTSEQLRMRQMAEPLREAIKENPALLATIQSSPNPTIAAYEVAKLHQKNTEEGESKKVTKKEAKDAIDEAVENANRTKSSSNVKGGGALSEEGRYASMSDEQFVAQAIANGAQI